MAVPYNRQLLAIGQSASTVSAYDFPELSLTPSGLTLFSTYSAYFFDIAGLSDPFAATAINSGIGIAAVLIAAACVEKVGRRLLNCVALTIMLAMNLAVGILGVAPSSGAGDILLVVFTVFWSKSVDLNTSLRQRPLSTSTAQQAGAISAKSHLSVFELIPLGLVRHYLVYSVSL